MPMRESTRSSGSFAGSLPPPPLSPISYFRAQCPSSSEESSRGSSSSEEQVPGLTSDDASVQEAVSWSTGSQERAASAQESEAAPAGGSSRSALLPPSPHRPSSSDESSKTRSSSEEAASDLHLAVQTNSQEHDPFFQESMLQSHSSAEIDASTQPFADASPAAPPLSPISYFRAQCPSSSDSSEEKLTILSSENASVQEAVSWSTESHESEMPFQESEAAPAGSSSRSALPHPSSPLSCFKAQWPSSSDGSSKMRRSSEEAASDLYLAVQTNSQEHDPFSQESMLQSRSSSEIVASTQPFADACLTVIRSRTDKMEAVIKSTRPEEMLFIATNVDIVTDIQRYAGLISALVKQFIEDTFRAESSSKKKRVQDENAGEINEQKEEEDNVEDEEEEENVEEEENEEEYCGEISFVTFASWALRRGVLAFVSVSRSLGLAKCLLQEKGLFFELLNISSMMEIFSSFVRASLSEGGASTTSVGILLSRTISEIIVKGVHLIKKTSEEVSKRNKLLADDQQVMCKIDGVLWMIITLLVYTLNGHQKDDRLKRECKSSILKLLAQCKMEAFRACVLQKQKPNNRHKASSLFTRNICLLTDFVQEVSNGETLITKDRESLQEMICIVCRMLETSLKLVDTVAIEEYWSVC